MEPSRSLYHSAARGLRISTIAAFLLLGLRFVWLSIFGRHFGPQQFGMAALLLVILEFVRIVCETALSEAIIQREHPSRRELSSLFWANLAIAATACAAIAAADRSITTILHVDGLKGFLQIGALGLLASGAASQFDALLRKELRFNAVALINVISAVVGLAVSLLLVFAFHLGLIALILGFFAETAGRALLLFAMAIRDGLVPRAVFHWQDVRDYLRFGAFRSGGILADNLCRRLDHLVIGYLMGSAAVGCYNLASNVTLPIGVRLNSIVTNVAFPSFALVQRDLPRLRSGYLKILKLVAFMNVPVYLGLALVAPVAVPLVLGSQWNESVPIIQVLCGVALIRALIQPVGTVMIARGYPQWSLYWNGGVLVATVATIVGVAAFRSLLVVSLGLLLVYVISGIVSYFALTRPLLGECGQEVSRAVGPTLLIGIFMAGVGTLLRMLLAHWEPWSVVILEILASALLYGTLTYAFEKDFVNTLLRGVRLR